MRVNNLEIEYSYILMHQSLKNDVITGGHKISLNEYNLFYSEDLDITEFNKDEKKLIVIGYLLDIRDGKLTGEDILYNLSVSKNVDRELDYINGRYVLIYIHDESITIYTDASALLPINYFVNKQVLSSHDFIIKEIMTANSQNITEVQQELKGAFDYTRYQDIFKFNPSLKLNVNTAEFVRYYPDSLIERKSVETVLKELDVYFNEMIQWLNRLDNKIILTLTGGYDSRVSMALTNSFSEKVEYITYLHPDLRRLSKRAQEIYEIDMFITRNISKNLNVNHTMVDLSNYNLQGDERKLALSTLQTSHSYSLIEYFRNVRKFNKVIHIKSTVFGMGKSDFPLNKNHDPQTFEEMTDFIHGVSKEALNLTNFNQIVLDFFERNLHDTNFVKGRHYFDIFHLESRMGNWHSNVTQETDPELLDFVFVNTRKIIDLLQSPSIQEKKDKVLYKKIINKYWPALLFIDFNEKNFNIDYYKIGLDKVKYINGLKVYELSNLSIEIKENDSFIIKPDNEFVGPQFEYVFKAKNNTHETKTLFLKSLYNKDSARKYIDVTIMKLHEKQAETLDIVKMFDGYDLTVQPFEEFMVKINYHNVFNKASWQQAGRIQVITQSSIT